MPDTLDAERLIPKTIPVFPLRNALLLPKSRLPLNIFEPRYIAMTDHALGAGRIIGMVRGREDGEGQPLYPVGCAGRISSFAETDDGRYMITLTGVCRFHIAEELDTTTPFRMVQADTTGFTSDLWPTEQETAALREKLLDVLIDYLEDAGLKADWESIEGASAQTIVNSVAMSCPFSPDEKQAILEAVDMTARAETLITLMEMAVAEGDGPGGEDLPKQRLQ